MPRNPYAGFMDMLSQALAGYTRGTQYKREKTAEQEFLKARTKKLQAETDEAERKAELLRSVLPSILAGDEGSPLVGPLAKTLKPAGRGNGAAPGGSPFPYLTPEPMSPAPGTFPMAPSPLSAISPPTSAREEGEAPIVIRSPTEVPRRDIADRKALMDRINRYKKVNLALETAGAKPFYQDVIIRELDGRFYAIDPNRGMEPFPISERTAKSVLEEQKAEVELDRARLSFARDLEETDRGYGVPAAKDVELWVKGEGSKPKMVHATQRWNREKHALGFVDSEGRPIAPDSIVPGPTKGKGKEGDGAVQATKLNQARAILADRMLPFALKANPPDDTNPDSWLPLESGYTPNLVRANLSPEDRAAMDQMLIIAERKLGEGANPAEAVHTAFDEYYGGRKRKGSRKPPVQDESSDQNLPTPEEALSELRRRGVQIR